MVTDSVADLRRTTVNKTHMLLQRGMMLLQRQVSRRIRLGNKHLCHVQPEGSNGNTQGNPVSWVSDAKRSFQSAVSLTRIMSDVGFAPQSDNNE
ncbi:hypothetical protein NPIL_482981 [Nephila pilipes]|uniref:Uncharacterized protein n=1 Tax=Nephila pilipes TaxID=299642 RepID=A0A8X6Q885_NEPPI|nr:hypothetical protein NPIL_482981 [Nephila pilipes]